MKMRKVENRIVNKEEKVDNLKQTIDFMRQRNKEDLIKSRINRNEKKYNACMTEGNTEGINKINKLNNSVYRLRNTPKKYKLDIGQTDNFMNSVKKIFLYNKGNKRTKNFYNNIKLFDYKNKKLDKEE